MKMLTTWCAAGAAVLLVTAAHYAPADAQTSATTPPLSPAIVAARQRAPQAMAVQRAATSIVAGLSVFQYAPNSRWIELVDGKQVRSYREEGRNASFTYIRLIEEGNQNPVRLDFLYNKVAYNNGNFNVPITSTSDKVDISNVTFVSYDGGWLRYRRNKIWTESSSVPGKRNFTFTETNRDCCNVYMFDASRGMNLAINLNSMGVFYSNAGTPQPTRLFNINKASAVQFFSRAIVD